MGDTQRSPTISTGRQGNAKACADIAGVFIGAGEPPVLTGGTSLQGLKLRALRNPDLVFTAVAHRIDYDLLRQSFRKLRRSDSSGVDRITARQYAGNLDQNLYNLYQRLRRGQYVAQPVKRVWIEKEGGKRRPIGITALEDKIVQKAVATIFDVIYDVNFHDFSYAFRRGRSQHKAIGELREACRSQNIGWIVSADVSGLFDNINHELLKGMIRRRVNDGGVIRLIGKWLKSGVMENGEVTYPEDGTPQGGVISPVLSNIYLHYLLDDWYVREVQPRMAGRCFLIRWADDFILGFESKSDALRVMDALPKRLEKYKLALHPEKTKLIRFSERVSGKENGTFDFLGFTFYRSRSLKGYNVIKKKTAGKRKSRFMKGIWQWCRVNRHEPMPEQHQTLCSKLRGFYQYYGVRSNFKALEVVYEYTEKAWRRWLSQRSQNGKELFDDLRERYPLPKPRIVHNI